jgi:hypothetical protein
MRKFMPVLLSLLLLAVGVSADESGCPAHRASEQGFKAIEAFHHVLAPAWHKAWPSKDYEALFAAGPEFKASFEKIAGLKMDFKSEKRKATFETSRDKLAAMVNEYSAACEAKDPAKVHALMPKLHDAFEMTASAMLPVHYPQFDYMVAHMNSIQENHLKKGDMAELTAATATLVERADALTEESIPEDLSDKKTDIITDLTEIRELTGKLEDCCENDDLEGYREYMKKLNTSVNQFLERYI